MGAAPSPGGEPPEIKPTLQKSKEVAHTRPRWNAPSQEGAMKHLSPPQTAFDRRMSIERGSDSGVLNAIADKTKRWAAAVQLHHRSSSFST